MSKIRDHKFLFIPSLFAGGGDQEVAVENDGTVAYQGHANHLGQSGLCGEGV
jgi:hypothetical protein